MKNIKSKLNPNARKWVRALRSGKYKQTTGTLARVRKGEIRYCCLGVACELFVRHGKGLVKSDPDPKNRISFSGEKDTLPARVMIWLGIRDDCAGYGETSLAEKNDGGTKFSAIANIIESQPEGLFLK